ncbi:NUMOD4 domain-containing protein [Corynebacterium glyciniphilum]|uniref:NUMOD4 domain-containing protein n=1 Tax=Corynebacterium glyciniphilum TaxID=1404244 RepID=UPI003FD512EF
MAEEEWRDIPGYESKYQVSTFGRVRSLDRYVNRKDGSRHFHKGGVLRHGTQPANGYLYVTLYGEGKPWCVRVHQLVLRTFVRAPRPGEETRHLDGDPTNNRLENLAWGSHSENIQDVLKHGKHNNASRTTCKRGHAYGAPNSSVSRGRRCKACHAAHSYRVWHPEDKTSLQEIADRYYESYQEEV